MELSFMKKGVNMNKDSRTNREYNNTNHLEKPL